MRNKFPRRKSIPEENTKQLISALAVPSIKDIAEGKSTIEETLFFIGHAGSLLKQKKALAEPLLDYISNALINIGNGTDPAKALKIKKGSRRNNHPNNDLLLTFLVWDLYNNDIISIDEIFQIVGERANKSASTIRDIYYINAKTIEDTYTTLFPEVIYGKDA
jgi:hypothetical protein